jgi:hypothetical protein
MLEDLSMNITERTNLRQLQCMSLPDSTGRKPYLWPALISIEIASQVTRQPGIDPERSLDFHESGHSTMNSRYTKIERIQIARLP